MKQWKVFSGTTEADLETKLNELETGGYHISQQIYLRNSGSELVWTIICTLPSEA